MAKVNRITAEAVEAQIFEAAIIESQKSFRPADRRKETLMEVVSHLTNLHLELRKMNAEVAYVTMGKIASRAMLSGEGLKRVTAEQDELMVSPRILLELGIARPAEEDCTTEDDKPFIVPLYGSGTYFTNGETARASLEAAKGYVQSSLYVGREAIAALDEYFAAQPS